LRAFDDMTHRLYIAKAITYAHISNGAYNCTKRGIDFDKSPFLDSLESAKKPYQCLHRKILATQAAIPVSAQENTGYTGSSCCCCSLIGSDDLKFPQRLNEAFNDNRNKNLP